MKDEKQYHGYLALPRQALHLRKALGSTLFLFYLELVMLAYWSRNKRHLFGKVLMKQVEIAEKLNVDQSSISKRLTELNEINRYLIIRHKGYILLGFFPLFTTEVANKMSRNNYLNIDELYAEMHAINAIVQENYENNQERLLQKRRQSLIDSSKNNVSFNVISNEDSNDDMDIDEIDIGINKMNIDRMRGTND